MNEIVLIVDDSLTVRMDLAEAFEAASFRALPCATAAEARRALREEPVEIVILVEVVSAFNNDGLFMLRWLRTRWPLSALRTRSTITALGTVRTLATTTSAFIAFRNLRQTKLGSLLTQHSLA